MDYDENKIEDMVLALLWLATLSRRDCLARISDEPGKATIGMR
jgi:hypothetical protein